MASKLDEAYQELVKRWSHGREVPPSEEVFREAYRRAKKNDSSATAVSTAIHILEGDWPE